MMQPREDGDRKPIPDPTELTTAQLLRELLTLRELLHGEIESLKELMQQGFTGRDLALTAALNAAKEAATLLAIATTKQIDQQGTV